ncbi:hypothetical protein FRC02_009783, partial [Tulasnella sp. 418]
TNGHNKIGIEKPCFDFAHAQKDQACEVSPATPPNRGIKALPQTGVTKRSVAPSTKLRDFWRHEPTSSEYNRRKILERDDFSILANHSNRVSRQRKVKRQPLRNPASPLIMTPPSSESLLPASPSSPFNLCQEPRELEAYIVEQCRDEAKKVKTFSNEMTLASAPTFYSLDNHGIIPTTPRTDIHPQAINGPRLKYTPPLSYSRSSSSYPVFSSRSLNFTSEWDRVSPSALWSSPNGSGYSVKDAGEKLLLPYDPWTVTASMMDISLPNPDPPPSFATLDDSATVPYIPSERAGADFRLHLISPGPQIGCDESSIPLAEEYYDEGDYVEPCRISSIYAGSSIHSSDVADCASVNTDGQDSHFASAVSQRTSYPDSTDDGGVKYSEPRSLRGPISWMCRAGGASPAVSPRSAGNRRSISPKHTSHRGFSPAKSCHKSDSTNVPFAYSKQSSDFVELINDQALTGDCDIETLLDPSLRINGRLPLQRSFNDSQLHFYSMLKGNSEQPMSWAQGLFPTSGNGLQDGDGDIRKGQVEEVPTTQLGLPSAFTRTESIEPGEPQYAFMGHTTTLASWADTPDSITFDDNLDRIGLEPHTANQPPTSSETCDLLNDRGSLLGPSLFDGFDDGSSDVNSVD